MLKITDIDKINWLIDTEKQLLDLIETNKLGLADYEFVSPRVLMLQLNNNHPDFELKHLQALILNLLRDSVVKSINEARKAIFYHLEQLNVEV